MHIITQRDIGAINLQPVRADNLQSVADMLKLWDDAPFGVNSATEIYQ